MRPIRSTPRTPLRRRWRMPDENRQPSDVKRIEHVVDAGGRGPCLDVVERTYQHVCQTIGVDVNWCPPWHPLMATRRHRLVLSLSMQVTGCLFQDGPLAGHSDC